MAKKIHTTKLPSQIQAGDKIILHGNPYRLTEVIAEPVKSNCSVMWLIRTTTHPKGTYAEPTLRIPVLIE